MSKEEILREIRRTAGANGGSPLGMRTFTSETGIRHGDWFGIHWRTWGDACREAGFDANTLTPGFDDDDLLDAYARLARYLTRAPTKADLLFAKRKDSDFPSESSLVRRFGSYDALRERTREYCSRSPELSDILPLLASPLRVLKASTPETGDETSLGFVYLIKHGSRPHYKIGKTSNAVRREGEIRLQLPEKVQPIHSITTDDPSGVEAYWHSRFGKKRMEGEWFELSAEDVRVFKKWRRIS